MGADIPYRTTTEREGFTMTALDTMTAAYVECALWSTTDNADDTGGEPLDANYGPDDLDPETLAAMRADCADFLALLEREGVDRSAWSDEQLGHDLWLTRNGHGAGFWDRGHGPVGDTLTAYAHPYGEVYLYVGDDGRIYAG
jgi:hypothetical protein